MASTSTSSPSAEEWFNLAEASPLDIAVGGFVQRWEAAVSEFNQREANDLDSLLGPNRPPTDIRSWEKSWTKLEFERISRTNVHLLKLWKFSCNFLHTSPISILSPRHGITYEPQAMVRIGNQYALWSEAFCQALSGLVCHPIWGQKAKRLTAAIQFAAICRLDDRRPWTLAGYSTSCQDMKKLRQMVSSERNQQLHELCENYILEQMARGQEPSWHCMLFCHIGTYARENQHQMNNHSPHTPPRLAVHISDLQAVTKAIHHLYPFGKRLDLSYSEIIAGAATKMRLQNAFPSSSELKNTHIRSFLNELRLAGQDVSSNKSVGRASQPTTTSGCSNARRATSHRPAGIEKKWKRGNRRKHARHA
ncbi:hypothetical protein J3458_001728 [Metarhizium acridum]|uniref:Uncharacterized protein n=1 Tax=Metarhizium acridum (strain CQMa 102) TaxID=655827 RepID=E9E812_METAQ|nr:uncharacterized protein MAC_06010 [Metarhizium acridum CQMa 102]EFY87883.1 hypothetical protein MAC_06010 [Metarhizium acridum CQMa 102]KAG8424982.1 hypothetical protein J3458_001728 [Metarhizium acridum]